MKTFLALIILALVTCTANAQTTPESFLGKLPSPPGGICATGENSGRSEFMEMVGKVDRELKQELVQRRKKAERSFEANEDKMKQNAMARTGVSPQMMQQMMAIEKASKGATGEQAKAYNAQKKAMVDQMMQQSMNMSMGEIENLKKMDKDGKKAWAEAYATEKKAEVMADPQAYQQKNAALKKDMDLVQKQQQLSDSLGGKLVKFMKQFDELENDKGAQQLLTKIDMLEAELNELYKKDAVNESEVRGKLNAIRNLEIDYCNMQSPKYAAILANYRDFLSSSIKPYYRLEKLTNQITAAQTGVNPDIEPGLMGLEQINSYLSRLSDVYRYSHIRPLATYVGAE